ncbi:hypothetical protein C2S51_013487 [Perilla frutescens var. frutescens]|nr:hypothetical protein C2S51_013487 [Perilla frutescens var. frutescens]
MDEESEKSGVDDLQKNSSMKRVCRICGKAFSSGKALGGHMRSHVQLRKKIEIHRNVTFKEKSCSDCVICGKSFPSMKSLFGHMRCHPEREWRGINPPPPPPPPPSSSSSSSSISLSDSTIKKIDDRMRNMKRDGGVIDLTESLRGWPVTAKRGRKAAASDDEAVNFLMMLAEGGRKDFGEVVDDDEMKVLMKRKKRKKVKLCDLNLMEINGDGGNNIPIPISTPACGKVVMDFDLNEVPQSETDHDHGLPSW